MDKKHILIIPLAALALLFASSAKGQEFHASYDDHLPVLAVKTNLLYWATTTPNLGLEFGLGKRITLDVSGNYNPWTFDDNKKLQHWLVQPELRVWLAERFQGHFFGLHAFYGKYDAGGIRMLGMKDYRYDGSLCGVGISYGHQWIIGKRWNLEATIGVGYANLRYDKYAAPEGGQFLGHDKDNYFGPTKIGISFIYIIK